MGDFILEKWTLSIELKKDRSFLKSMRLKGMYHSGVRQLIQLVWGMYLTGMKTRFYTLIQKISSKKKMEIMCAYLWTNYVTACRERGGKGKK